MKSLEADLRVQKVSVYCSKEDNDWNICFLQAQIEEMRGWEYLEDPETIQDLKFELDSATREIAGRTIQLTIKEYSLKRIVECWGDLPLNKIRSGLSLTDHGRQSVAGKKGSKAPVLKSFYRSRQPFPDSGVQAVRERARIYRQQKHAT